MTRRLNHQTYGQRLTDVWLEAWIPLVTHRKKLLTGYLLGATAISVVSAFRIQPSFEDLPQIVLAGLVLPLQFAGIVALIWFFVVARITHTSAHEWLEYIWTERERLRRPNVSFAVPYWRFSLLALVPATLVFVALAVPVVMVVYLLPDHLPIVRRVLQIFSSPD